MYQEYRTTVKGKDLVLFITQDDISLEDEIKIKQLCEDLAEDLEASIVVIPENILKEAKRLDIESLITLREVFDQAIRAYIERDAIPE